MLPGQDWSVDFDELRQFLASWHDLPFAAVQYRQTYGPVQLPVVLDLFYQMCGEHLNHVVSYNKFVSRDSLLTGQVPLVFCQECQGVWIWAAKDNSDNPPVLCRENESGAEWEPEAEKLCTFLRQLCIFDAIQCAQFGASAAWCSREKLQLIIADWTPFELGAWRKPMYPTQFYQHVGSLAVVTPNQTGFTFKCGAKERGCLEFVRRHIDRNWEYVNV